VGATILQDLDGLRQKLAPHLKGARKAIVFGSVARGEADEWSDLDLVIVADTARPFLERYRDFEGIYDVWRRLDLLIYTPDEFAEMVREGRPFIEQVLREGVVVHEAESER
jgi:predicted nucleotidyltransferase